MTCSSTTISARNALALAAAALLALAAPGGAASPGSELIAGARQSLAQGDAIAAEVSLRKALAAGTPREAVAAYMGEAMLAQDAPEKARDWLEPGAFATESAAWGFRKLAELKRRDGDLAASGAFDRALTITPRDAAMWIEIARLRYAGGEHMLALDAGEYALKLDPDDVRALEFKGQVMRDRKGLAAGLPWFERALRKTPRDLSVLGEYAATLGDLGQAKKMLAVTRRMLAIAPGNPRAFFLQAVLAARAGKVELARNLHARTKDEFGETPAGLLLDGVLQMGAGNHGLAGDALGRLVRAQPANARAALLLARANALAGENGLVIHDMAAAAGRPEASPYLLTLVARAYEADGRRDLAAPLLDRAALGRRPEIYPTNSEVGGLIAAGQAGAARALADKNLASHPGSAFDQAIAGDVRLAAHDGAGALDHYRRAAYVRMSESLMLRMVAASLRGGASGTAAAILDGFRAANPNDRVAARMAAGEAARATDWPRARRLIEPFAAVSQDCALLADLSLAQLRSGDPKVAEATARRAYALQRSSPAAAAAWGLSLDALGQRSRAQALLAKSRAFN
jgi:cellulose synthase operon protein C